MSLFNIFKGRNAGKADTSNDDLWDASLEEISLGEQIRYKIASKFSTLKSGEQTETQTLAVAPRLS